MWDVSLSGNLLAYEVTRFAGGHKVAEAPAGMFWQCSEFCRLHRSKSCFESSLRSVFKTYHKHTLCKWASDMFKIDLPHILSFGLTLVGKAGQF